jgi:hypothetical protein
MANHHGCNAFGRMLVHFVNEPGELVALPGRRQDRRATAAAAEG